MPARIKTQQRRKRNCGLAGARIGEGTVSRFQRWCCGRRGRCNRDTRCRQVKRSVCRKDFCMMLEKKRIDVFQYLIYYC
jgi:hypothetical protein